MILNELTIKEAKQGLKNKKFSSVEITKACLEQIKKHNPTLNAYITVCEKEALGNAKKADNLASQDQVLEAKPFLGIPFSMKDVYSTKGIKTTAGSKVLDNYIPVYNATVYQKLIDAGAILLGKTNCDAWGHGSSTENSDFNVTKNPWNAEFVAGGSSGGSAAALSADMTIFEIGEDTGGSIRMPSSFCSAVGMKVTYGRVSRYGVIAYASSLDSVGPMAKNVYDNAYLLKVIAGKDKLDATSSPNNVPDYLKALGKNFKGLRIGKVREFFGKGLDIQVKDAIEKVFKYYEENGAEIVDISIPSIEYGIATYYIIAPSETSSNLARYDGIRFGNKRETFGDEAKRRIMIGAYALSAGYYDAYYKKAMQARTLIRQDFEKAFEKCDALISPVSPTPPFRIGEKVNDPLQMYLVDIYNVLINLAGIPALSVPCGFSKENLPIGMQILGPQFSEEKLFQIGHAYEQATEWRKRKPLLR